MSFWKNFAGTTLSRIWIGITGVAIGSTSNRLVVRNNADSDFAPTATSRLDITGNQLIANSEIANKYTLVFPTVGATTLEFPDDDGSPGQVLGTNGSGKLSFVTSADTSSCQRVDTTTLSGGSTATVNLFTLPANAVVEKVRIIVDTAFNGTPSVSVGITGQQSLYFPSTGVSLIATGNPIFEFYSTVPASTDPRNLVAFYSANGATSGSARIEVFYAVPA